MHIEEKLEKIKEKLIISLSRKIVDLGLNTSADLSGYSVPTMIKIKRGGLNMKMNTLLKIKKNLQV